MTRILLRPEDGVPCIVTLDGRKIAARLEGLDAIDAIRADPHARVSKDWTRSTPSVRIRTRGTTCARDRA